MSKYHSEETDESFPLQKVLTIFSLSVVNDFGRSRKSLIPNLSAKELHCKETEKPKFDDDVLLRKSRNRKFPWRCHGPPAKVFVQNRQRESVKIAPHTQLVGKLRVVNYFLWGEGSNEFPSQGYREFSHMDVQVGFFHRAKESLNYFSVNMQIVNFEKENLFVDVKDEENNIGSFKHGIVLQLAHDNNVGLFNMI